MDQDLDRAERGERGGGSEELLQEEINEGRLTAREALQTWINNDSPRYVKKLRQGQPELPTSPGGGGGRGHRARKLPGERRPGFWKSLRELVEQNRRKQERRLSGLDRRIQQLEDLVRHMSLGSPDPSTPSASVLSVNPPAQTPLGHLPPRSYFKLKRVDCGAGWDLRTTAAPGLPICELDWIQGTK
uniref:Protein Rev n=1 Tax=Bovine immunodeficiency virus (strain R29) TaxID=417296 RepID=REV_BIV29|nr:RecName: Full=Protein Rev [Bovine immunodeficiency virus R29]AAA42772.1 Rev protein 1 [Bovine immunodeficiency virus]